jgi:hypothetical protein
MNIQALFGLSVFMSFVNFGLVTHLYIWPRLRILERVKLRANPGDVNLVH